MKLERSPESRSDEPSVVGEMPPATTASEAPKRGTTNEWEDILGNMSAADSTIGAERSPATDKPAVSEEFLASLSPEARENAEAIVGDFAGEVAVASEVQVTPDVLKHEVYEVDGVTPLPEDEYSEDSARGLEDISTFLTAEAAAPGSTDETDPATIIETAVDGGSTGGHDTEIATSSSADEPTPKVETVATAPTERELYNAKESARISEDVDSIAKSSLGIASIERFKTAKAEKEYRRNVREVNKGGVRQEVRDAKLNLRITEQTYNRSGKRFLRRLEREKMKSEIDKRRADGTFNLAQAKIAKLRTVKKARTNVEARAVGAIKKAEDLVVEKESNKDKFFDQYGRRNNSTRKNLQRVRGRIATHTNYQGAGEVRTSPVTSMAETWASDEWTKKRAEMAKRKEAEDRARTEAARKVATTRSRHSRPVATKAPARTPSVRITGPRTSFS